MSRSALGGLLQDVAEGSRSEFHQQCIGGVIGEGINFAFKGSLLHQHAC